ncbi:CoA transferase [Rhizobium wenxiniae]|uniref:Crotonobetainyl-CoA:carnitine CoA-transferase CaiB-like acyl-CoA transferase n=1 Tax=Rhizobium wenxiniae TaxID=1737357 RepID=A0A7W9YB74_9HYPH|nr:CoA transferase [Rhizobium wenxiniae]MBB6165306.1 crotonobetainyl-CoA:carnitine CoA-transferase CaiB-like acyl-CoA transferase [Rhizobium wenxiniae]GGG14389.1 CoA transferase [Rhizobium wenxiniae]
MTDGLLSGLRVLDLTSVVVGPTCTWRLGQYGAEVIKVESPEGDLMRGLGGLSPTGQHSGTYLHLNRGKRNICLDLKKPGAADVIEKLVEWCDVVVANMRPKALERLGLDAASILAKHPSKIHCLITGYGTDGPYAGRPTYDSVVQGVSGIGGLFAGRDGTPAYVPLVVCDHVVGEIATGAILAAVLKRNAGGGGGSLEIPMFETMAAFVLQEHLAQESFNPPVGTAGDKRLLNSHNKPLKTADGWISVTINTDPQVRAFLTAVGRDGLLADPRFATVASRAKNVEAWFEVRGAALSDRTTAEWLDIFRAADIAAMPCHTLTSLRSDEHIRAVGLISSESHPTEGEVAVIRSTIRSDNAYAAPRGPAQPKGWETLQILEEIGIDHELIGDLVATGTAIHSALGPDPHWPSGTQRTRRMTRA